MVLFMHIFFLIPNYSDSYNSYNTWLAALSLQ